MVLAIVMIIVKFSKIIDISNHYQPTFLASFSKEIFLTLRMWSSVITMEW